MTELETRLRAELNAAARDVRTSPDAWQRNQRRLEGTRARRVRVPLVAAAVIVAIATVVGIGAFLGGGGSGGLPADGDDDPFSARHLLGEPVEAETPIVDGQRAIHEVALSDMTGKGPNLCDRYVVDGGSVSSCTARDPDADAPKVAFDWFSGTEGGGDIRGVLGGVDGRVAFVVVWMTDGQRVRAQLRPGGWEDINVFALTVPNRGPVPQRVVATGRDGNVLQAVDLPTRFGDTWLTQHSACAGDQVAEFGPDRDAQPNAHVALGTTDAMVSVRTEWDNTADACLERLRPQALAGWYPGGLGLVAAVLAPEVATVRLASGNAVIDEVTVSALTGTPWRVAVLRASGHEQLARAELVALDAHGLMLDRQPAGQIGWATP